MTSDIGHAVASYRESAGMTQEGLAVMAGCSYQAVKDLEDGQDVGIHALECVLAALGMSFRIVRAGRSVGPTAPVRAKVPTFPEALPPLECLDRCRVKYRYLVWSNPDGASDETFIMAALLNPRILVLADFAKEYGLERIREIWKTVAETPDGRVHAPTVERILRNFALSEARQTQSNSAAARGPAPRATNRQADDVQSNGSD